MRSILLCLLLLACHATYSQAAKPKLPNVVLILSDDQAWGDYGFMGHREIKTPHLDRLAKQSAVFTRGYVPSSLCRPSLASIITGLYPHQHKITGNDPPKGTDRNAMLKHIQSVATLPKMLATKNYLSLQTGKWWEGHPRLGGFTHAMTHGDTKRGGRHGDEGLKIGRQGMKPIKDFIDNADGKPFFLWYAPFLPHRPHNPPQRLLKHYIKKAPSIHIARYWAMCQWFDETCGELLSYLDKKGLSENTIVIYVCDNGWIQQQKKQGYAIRSKRSPYDGGVRTPIMIRWPKKVQPARYTMPVSSIDLAPTILAACDLKPTKAMPGINLLDLCNGKKSSRQQVFGAIYSHDAVNIDNPSANLLHRWTVDQRWKLIVSKNNKQVELFDIVNDPYEKNNLALKSPKRVKQMTATIDRWWSPQGQSKSK